MMCMLEDNPMLTTREIATSIGISNGAASYLRSALINKGLVKTQNFPKPAPKAKNAHVLTPAGTAEQNRLTRLFLVRKFLEYQDLELDVAKPKSEVSWGDACVKEQVQFANF